MVFAALIFVVAAAAGAIAVGVSPGQITDLVTFGDSYTDVVDIGDLGAAAWPNYTANYAHIQLHPFAKSGATCSNKLTLRPAPSFLESQLPLYLEEIANHSLVLRAENTVYSIWLLTNDIGRAALLTGDDPNVSVVEVTECIIEGVKTLYKSGARNFIIQNMIPLELTVLYSAKSYPNLYWAFERNTTEWSIFIREMTHAVNKLTELMLQALAPTLPGAHIALFNSHSLFQDMFDHPAQYLNGTAPLNVTFPWESCVAPLGGGTLDCTIQNGTDRDSYLWADELHPSEQADRIVAREMALTLEGKKSQWATWLS